MGACSVAGSLPLPTMKGEQLIEIIATSPRGAIPAAY
jgi:hypothetical protein